MYRLVINIGGILYFAIHTKIYGWYYVESETLTPEEIGQELGGN